MTARWLTAAQTLERLGVRPQTLYAYVSRGRIEQRPDDADPRRSLYRAADVEALSARKARGRRTADVASGAIAWGEPVLASAITAVIRERLYYRGRDAVELSRTATLEEAAALLWGAPSLPAAEGRPPPRGSTVKARIFLALAEAAGRDPPSGGRAAPALIGDAARILGLVGDAAAGAAHEGPLHLRLARAGGCDAAGADLIRQALVLMADHELNASSFAARVAASTGASLSAAALAGLSTLSGPRHGGAFLGVRAYLREARALGPRRAVEARLAQGLPIPGFGHPLYPAGDPRALALLDGFALSPEAQAARRAAEAVTGQAANIDFALCALAAALGLPDEAPFALFAVGRCAGWLAHGLEQAQAGSLIRPRARYVGPMPGTA